nr:hypothetical protein [Microctonus hyperodae filamentous virus]
MMTSEMETKASFTIKQLLEFLEKEHVLDYIENEQQFQHYLQKNAAYLIENLYADYFIKKNYEEDVDIILQSNESINQQQQPLHLHDRINYVNFKEILIEKKITPIDYVYFKSALGEKSNFLLEFDIEYAKKWFSHQQP